MYTKGNDEKLEDGSYVIHNCYFPVNLPSYDRNINILLYPDKSPNHIYIELSLPKAIFKNNILTPTREQYKQVVSEIHSTLSSKIGKIPPTTLWVIQRLDLAVQWQYEDATTLKSVLNVLKQFGDTNYPTGTYKSKTTKFYLKNPEYLKHDYKWLYAQDPKMADNLSKVSEGLLRFEVCLRGKVIFNSFNCMDWDTIINSSDTVFDEIIRRKLLSFYNYLEPVMMTPEEAFSILARKYSQEMAIKLIGYMRIRDGNNPDKKETLKVFSRQQRSKWNILLRKAKVGINAETQVQVPKVDRIVVWRCLPPQVCNTTSLTM